MTGLDAAIESLTQAMKARCEVPECSLGGDQPGAAYGRGAEGQVMCIGHFADELVGMREEGGR